MIDIKHFEPNKRISKYVRKISLFNSKGKIKFKQKLTPSAYTYFSYNHKDIPISIFGDKKVRPKSRLMIAGPKINEDIFVEYNGDLFQILIEFNASGFYYLFHHSPLEFVNGLSDLKTCGKDISSDQLEKELLHCKDLESMVKLLEEFLSDMLQNALPFVDYIEKALSIIEKNHGNINVGYTAKEIGISERQFDRKFREIVGISPKRYAKLYQLHYVINLMNLKTYKSIQDLAFQAEFYDLAHFTNRFKELTGFSPTEFLKSKKHIALKYFNDLLR
ncbi:MAG: helix-turn-helix domain-containing protein [Melioribacteraceae bacterium]|nr:helix-turn-helix domain-containing protein [Melioribacteraceae bacterium]